MNKRHWNTITLDGSLPDHMVTDLLRDSYVHPDIAAALRSYAAAGFEQADPDQAAEWNSSQPIA